MARLLTLLCLAASVYVALGDSSTVLPSAPMSATVTPSKAEVSTSVMSMTSTMATTSSMAKSSSMGPAPSVTPTPSPMPPPSVPTDKKYFINNTDKTVCLRMDAAIVLKFSYKSYKENRTRDVDFISSFVTVHPDSYCNAKDLRALLKLQFTPKDQSDPYLLSFNFFGEKSTYNVSDIIVEFTFNATDFPMYNGTTPPTKTLNSSSDAKLFDGGDVNLNQSFSCNVNKTVDFSPAYPYINVTLILLDLQVQAFDFTEPKTGTFDRQVFCREADTGNKIVPIAVGAALAGLVIVVLVAYLIGRLRNRKKSSYEALS